MSENVAQVLQISLTVSAIIGAVFGLKQLIIFFNDIYRRSIEVYDVLIGTDKKPGIDERVSKLETWADNHTDKLESLTELRPNGGSTLKDQVNNIQATLNTLMEAMNHDTARQIRSAHESVGLAGTEVLDDGRHSHSHSGERVG